MCKNTGVSFSSYGFLKWEFAFIHQVGQLGGEEQGPPGPSTLPQGRMEGWKVNGDESVTFPQEA